MSANPVFRVKPLYAQAEGPPAYTVSPDPENRVPVAFAIDGDAFIGKPDRLLADRVCLMMNEALADALAKAGIEQPQ